MTGATTEGCIKSNFVPGRFRLFFVAVGSRIAPIYDTTYQNRGASNVRFRLVQVAMKQKDHTAKLQKLKHYIESLCGIYSRIARRLGVDRTYVSRVAKGERRSPQVESALIREFDRTQEKGGD